MQILRFATAVFAVLAVAGAALAQETYKDSSNPGVSIPSVVQKCLNTAGQAIPVSSGQCANPAQVTITGLSGAPVQTSVSVGTSSGQLVAPGAFANFLRVCIAQNAANGIWVNWTGAAATAAAPSEYIAPGQCDTWVKSAGFLPTAQVNAIASAAVAATVMGN